MAGERDSGDPATPEKNARLSRVVDDAVQISDRFAREPVLARGGKGYYKSAGVEGLKDDIERLKRMKADDADR